MHSKLDVLFRQRKPIIVAAFLFLTLSVTLVMVKQQQDSRTHAAYFTTCNPAPTTKFSAVTDHQAASRLKTATNTVEQILHSNLNTQTADPEKWRTQVAQRKIALLETMHTKPNEALKNILDPGDQIQGKLLSDNCVEQQVNVEGTLATYVVDNFSASGETIHTLFSNNGQEYRVHFANDVREPLKPGVKLRMHGYQVDNEILVNAADTSAIQTITPGGTDMFSAIPASQGNQSVAAILISMQSSPASPLSANGIDSSVMNNINNYYKENSYGKTQLHWDVFGWYTVNNFTSCSDMNDVQTIVNTALNTAASKGMKVQDYTRFVVFLNDASNLGCPFDGIGTIGIVPMNVNGQTQNKSWALALQKSSTGTNTIFWQSMVAGHELGHNFGDGHASSWDCGNVPLAQSGCDKAGVTGEYGDMFDIMGSDFAHMNAYHKEYIGWLTSTQVPTITKSGTYTIEPIETNTGGIKAIKIPRGADDYLYVEYKQKIGVDSNLGGNKPTDVYNGALIHILLGNLHSGLIDTSPPLDTPRTYTPALKVGQTLTDPATGVKVTTKSANSSALVVDVLFPGTTLPDTTPTPTAPSGVTATPTIPVAGGTVTPTPTFPAGSVALKLKAALSGVGSGTGNNPSPINSSPKLYVEVYTLDNQKVYEGSTATQYDSSAGAYVATAGTSVAPGKYYVKIRTDNTLWRRVGNILDLKAGSNTLADANLIQGDFNSDNQLTMLDYSQFVSCYGTKSCVNKPLYDLNFDGNVDGVDYNILLRNFAFRMGD